MTPAPLSAPNALALHREHARILAALPEYRAGDHENAAWQAQRAADALTHALSSALDGRAEAVLDHLQSASLGLRAAHEAHPVIAGELEATFAALAELFAPAHADAWGVDAEPRRGLRLDPPARFLA